MYSPKIREELISKLYVIGKRKGKSMTAIVDEFLRIAIEKEEREYKFAKERLSK
ncbi:MAG: hypothetical protein Q8O30_06480 [Candidatus Omnitrophota bacterium]|nr:hypothetical protein [Candidatus Omnitrophota bacterium]